MNIFVSTLPFVYMQAQTGLLVFHCLVPVKKKFCSNHIFTPNIFEDGLCQILPIKYSPGIVQSIIEYNGLN